MGAIQQNTFNLLPAITVSVWNFFCNLYVSHSQNMLYVHHQYEYWCKVRSQIHYCNSDSAVCMKNNLSTVILSKRQSMSCYKWTEYINTGRECTVQPKVKLSDKVLFSRMRLAIQYWSTPVLMVWRGGGEGVYCRGSETRSHYATECNRVISKYFHRTVRRVYR